LFTTFVLSILSIIMPIFVTGASGFVGVAVLKELLNHGYSVLALARSDASAKKLSELGATPHRGDLEDLESLKEGAKKSDGVIHLAFNPDFTNFDHESQVEATALEAIGEALQGSGKPLIVTSGTMALPKGSLNTEATEADSSIPRARSSNVAYKLAKESNVRAMVLRLSIVHDVGDTGFIPGLIEFAKKSGESIYVEEGKNRWPAVHRQDAAVLFRHVLEKGRAGANYHAVAEEGVETKSLATVIGNKLSVPTVSKSLDDAAQSLGFLGYRLAAENSTSSAKTREEFGWKPVHKTLLEDLELNYF
jgi:nucleoside-diphosphate-sugar epimerase